MRKLISLLLIFSQLAYGQTVIDAGFIRGFWNGQPNKVANPIAEKNTLGWTASNVIANSVTTTGNKLYDISSFSLTTATNPATFTSSAINLSDGVTGDCQAWMQFKGDGTKWKFALMNGATELASVPLTNETNWRGATFNYPCASGYTLRVTSTAASPANINVGDFYWGKATNLGLANPTTAWQSYTPIMKGSTNGVTFAGASSAGRWRQVGDSVEVDISATFSGALTGGIGHIQWTLPNAIQIDTSKLASIGPNADVETFNKTYNSGNAVAGSALVAYDASDANPNTVKVLFTKNPIATDYLAVSYPGAWQSGDLVRFKASFPIIGWASQTAVRMNQQTLPTLQKFLSGSGTYTTPQGVSWIRVRMVGGGGGGAGEGSAAGTDGVASTFGTSLLSAGGGAKATSSATGGAGGSASCGSIASCLAVSGGYGGAIYNAIGTFPGGVGGSTCFGGNGSAGPGNGNGTGGAANTGGGGGGAGGTSAAIPGGGGGGGGCIDATISSPSASYSYSVGTGGSGGANGGSSGGSGYIEVTEYYGSMNAPLLVGSVTSSSAGMERVERAAMNGVCSSGTCALSSSTPGISSIVYGGATGVYTVALPAGTFSAAPTCTCSSNIDANVMCSAQSANTTAVTLKTYSTAPGYANTAVNLICTGPR